MTEYIAGKENVMKTNVYIDGAPIDFEDTEGTSTLGDLVGAVEGQIRTIRRYVDGVSIDGRPLTGWRAAGPLGSPLGGHNEVRLQTASFDEVAAEAASTLGEYAGVIKKNIEVCVASLRRGGPAGAEFTSVAEGSIELVKTIEALAKASGAYGGSQFRSDPLECCSSVMNSLESLKAAGQNADSVWMADILEYELSEALTEVEFLITPQGA